MEVNGLHEETSVVERICVAKDCIYVVYVCGWFYVTEVTLH